MRLVNKVAVVYGGGGSMGGAAARALAAAGAIVVVAGRTATTLERVVDDIVAAGGRAEAAVVDVDDTAAVDAHARSVADRLDGYDIAFNAVGMAAVQDIPLAEMELDDFMTPVVQSARRQFNTATAAARQMTIRRSGTIVLLSSTAAREWRHRMGGFNLACAGVEALTRSLAGELGPVGVRVVCIRPNLTPETVGLPPGDSPGDLSEAIARLARDTALGRLPRLDEVAATVVFAASDAAGAMSGAVLNLSVGAIVD